MLDVVDRACARWGMQISVRKTKILAVEEQTADQQTTNQPSTLQGQTLEQLELFSYLGSEVGQSAKVKERRDGQTQESWTVNKMCRRKVIRRRNLGKAKNNASFPYTGYVSPPVR